jgi:hypothetical protein
MNEYQDSLFHMDLSTGTSYAFSNIINYLLFIFSLAVQPSAGYDLLVHEVSWSHTTTRHCKEDSSGRVISSSQRPLSDNTRHTQQSRVSAQFANEWNPYSYLAVTDVFSTELGIRLRFVKALEFRGGWGCWTPQTTPSVRHCNELRQAML